jgi:hypothetical protein
MWEATTGRFFRMFSGITPSISGITCGTLDSPRDRHVTSKSFADAVSCLHNLSSIDETNVFLRPCLVFYRRLFLGDEGGNVLLINTINGTLLNKVRPHHRFSCFKTGESSADIVCLQVALHSKEVTSLAYCGTTGYLMSTGADGRLVMAYEVPTLRPYFCMPYTDLVIIFLRRHGDPSPPLAPP